MTVFIIICTILMRRGDGGREQVGALLRRLPLRRRGPPGPEPRGVGRRRPLRPPHTARAAAARVGPRPASRSFARALAGSAREGGGARPRCVARLRRSALKHTGNGRRRRRRSGAAAGACRGCWRRTCRKWSGLNARPFVCTFRRQAAATL